MGLRPIALFVLIGLSAAACTSGSGQSSDIPSPSPSSVVTSIHSTPTSSAPVTTSSSSTVRTTGPNVRPGEKPPKPLPITRKDVAVGAANYATYWIQTLDWGYATTDSTLSNSVFSSSCRDCARFVRLEFDALRKTHRHYIGGRLDIASAFVASNDKRFHADFAIDVRVNQTKLHVVDSSGRVTGSSPASRNVVFRTWLKWSGRRWVVVDWKTVDFK